MNHRHRYTCGASGTFNQSHCKARRKDRTVTDIIGDTRGLQVRPSSDAVHGLSGRLSYTRTESQSDGPQDAFLRLTTEFTFPRFCVLDVIEQ